MTSRRRFLTISAAALGCSGLPAAASTPVARWRGRAMGAQTGMVLVGLDDTGARRAFHAVERELARLERIFSLYVTDSQLSQLNATGILKSPAPELLEVLSLSDALNAASGGAFDPSLQPLWLLRARTAAQGRAATPGELDAARALVGWDEVRFDAGSVRLAPGMALTLNGVAQGFVTDRIAALLRGRGLHDVLVDMGEIAALGRRADGADWTAGIARPDGRIVNRVALRDRALATSAPEGTLLGANQGHILDPRAPSGAPKHGLVAVSADRAAVADGLSTALCLLSKEEAGQTLLAFSGARLETLEQLQEKPT
ncbi:FAD:protein FMN transferase [Pukyongiella litopenaei]|uniref:FAD:protein FMN transferase n=1 Tax=Pukyongiella litopenaei TaxID=2605946 RepID=A0A2S0MS26_9RHOB|nr:FAD:protein FMN transferase [Pukyongiella litopenaei]